jgi:hypothetical protein
MPSYFPENNDASAFEDQLRAKHKICSVLFTSAVSPPASRYPEGCRPMPGDDELRLNEKIMLLRASYAGLDLA